MAALATVAWRRTGIASRFMGISRPNSGQTLTEWVRHLNREPLGPGCLVPPPHYIRPSQQGLVDWFYSHRRCEHGAAVLVYDIPYRTGATGAERATLLALAAHPKHRRGQGLQR